MKMQNQIFDLKNPFGCISVSAVFTNDEMLCKTGGFVFGGNPRFAAKGALNSFNENCK